MKIYGNALVIIGLVLMMLAVVYGSVGPIGDKEPDRGFVSFLFAVNGIFLFSAGNLLRRKKRPSDEPPPTITSLKDFVPLFLCAFLLVGGVMGLTALDIDAPWIRSYLCVGQLVLIVLVYKETRKRISPEAANDALPWMAFACIYFGGTALLMVVSNLNNLRKASPWTLPAAFIAYVVVRIAVNKSKADRAGDGKLSETEEPGSGSSPAKESEDSGE